MSEPFTTYHQAAEEAADAILCAAEGQDPIALTIAANNLDLALAKLWELRELRELRDIDWQTIFNHAQGMLKQLVAEKRVESLTPEQCRAIRELVEDYLGSSIKTTADLNEAIRLIEDAGCDPYWAISGPPAGNVYGR